MSESEQREDTERFQQIFDEDEAFSISVVEVHPDYLQGYDFIHTIIK